MSVQRLQISGLRNLRLVRQDRFTRVNIVSGANGSGKTSLLEGLYMLGSGRSFRSSRLQPVIARGNREAVIFAEVLGPDGACHSIGVARSLDEQQRYRVDQKNISGVSELARLFPVQILDGESFSLIDGGPALRRRYLDWAVFHVKPDFIRFWRGSQKAVRQRNHLLRGGGLRGWKDNKATTSRDRMEMSEARGFMGDRSLSIRAWEQELAACGSTVDRLRYEVFCDLEALFQCFMGHFNGLPRVEMTYRRGWKAGESLEALLERGRSRDIDRGFTQAGPHRADIWLGCDGGRPAADYLSRGQKKLVVAVMKLAQCACLEKHGLGESVLLVDDLPAELDGRHRQTFCRLLSKLGSQVFITSVDADVIEDQWFFDPESGSAEMAGLITRFHVEQGEYRCLTT